MDIPSHHNLPGTSHDLFLQQSHCSFPEKEEKPSKMDHHVQMHMPGTDKPMENFCFDLLIDWLINMSLGTEMQVCCTCSSKLQGTVPSGLFWSSQKKKNSWLLHIYTQLSYTPQKAPNSQFPNLYPIFPRQIKLLYKRNQSRWENESQNIHRRTLPLQTN